MRARIWLGALFASLILLGCAGTREPGVTTVSAEEKREYSQALAALGTDRAGGIAALQSFVDRYPRSRLADDASLRLAELAVEDGRETDALQHLSWVLRRHPRGDRSDAARLEFAKLKRARGHPQSAYRTATEIRFSMLTAEERREAHRLLADLAGENGKTGAQLRWLGKVRSDQDDEQAAARIEAEIDQVLQAMGPEELESAAEQLGRRALAGRVRLQQAEVALRAGDLAAAEVAIAHASKLPLSQADASRLVALETALRDGLPQAAGLFEELPSIDDVRSQGRPDPSTTPGTLGVVLPLSGSFAAYGEQSLLGILLAAGSFDETTAGAKSKLRILVRDSSGTAAGAQRGVRSLAAEPGLVAIIGPLLADEAESAAAAAEDEGVPLIALTRREEVARGRPHVIRLGSNPRLEAELLADYALRRLGSQRFAILYPRDSYGLVLRSAFWDAVEAGGGSVVGVAAYDPDGDGLRPADSPHHRLRVPHACRARGPDRAQEAPETRQADATRARRRAAQRGGGDHRTPGRAATAVRRLRRAVHSRLPRERRLDRSAPRLSRRPRRETARA